MRLEFTLNGKPIAEGVDDLKAKLAAGLKKGLEAAGETVLERIHEVASTGYTRGFGWHSGGGGSARWPWLADATLDAYSAILGVPKDSITPETHPGLIHPDESRELTTSLTKGGAGNIFVVGRPNIDGIPTEVKVGSNIIYARVHEFGAVIQIGDSVVVIPPRPYMSPGLYMSFDDGKVHRALNKALAEELAQLEGGDEKPKTDEQLKRLEGAAAAEAEEIRQRAHAAAEYGRSWIGAGRRGDFAQSEMSIDMALAQGKIELAKKILADLEEFAGVKKE